MALLHFLKILWFGYGGGSGGGGGGGGSPALGPRPCSDPPLALLSLILYPVTIPQERFKGPEMSRLSKDTGEKKFDEKKCRAHILKTAVTNEHLIYISAMLLNHDKTDKAREK